MIKLFLTKLLLLAIALQSLTLSAHESAYSSFPVGYANSDNKIIDVQTEQLLSKINQTPHFDTLSYYEFAEGYFIGREDIKFFWNNYLAQIQAQERKDPFISPLQVDSLIGLPPALLIIANFDPLRDEGLAYSLRLFRDSVPTHVKRFNSIHGFYAFQELDASKEAIDFISSYLAEKFSK